VKCLFEYMLISGRCSVTQLLLKLSNPSLVCRRNILTLAVTVNTPPERNNCMRNTLAKFLPPHPAPASLSSSNLVTGESCDANRRRLRRDFISAFCTHV